MTRSRPPRRPRRLPALAAALLALTLAAPARAETGPLPVRVAPRDGRLRVSVDLSAALEGDLARRLGNGLTNVLAIWISVAPEQGAPVAAVARVAEILFDVWDETYAVTIHDGLTTRPPRRVAADWASARRLVAELRDLDLGPVAELPGGRLVVEARVELNPVSRELMQRTRELLAHSSTGSRPGTGSRSVLGAMAGWLLRDPDAPEDLLSLRSRPIEPAELAPR